MSERDRIAIYPSRANLVLVKQRITSAQNGWSLLKKKRDALEMQLRKRSAELILERKKLNAIMQEAMFSLAKAKFLGTDFKSLLVMNPGRASTYLRVQTIKILGLQVPTLELVMEKSNALKLTGLASGGQQVQKVRENFQAALKILVPIASLEYSVKVISASVKQTNTRKNGLEFAVLPRYKNTMAYISEGLDDLEREDFYRLKRSQGKQLKKRMDFINLLRQRTKEKDGKDPGYDFPDIHLETGELMKESRKPVSRIADTPIVITTEDSRPLVLDTPSSKILQSHMNVELAPEKVMTSSSSSESYSSD